jgi:hypothetical protein
MQKLSRLINDAVRWLSTVSFPKSLNLPVDEIAKVLCYGNSNTWGYVPGISGGFFFSTLTKNHMMCQTNFPYSVRGM